MRTLQLNQQAIALLNEKLADACQDAFRSLGVSEGYTPITLKVETSAAGGLSVELNAHLSIEDTIAIIEAGKCCN